MHKYRCPKCGGTIFLLEAIFDCVFDGENFECIEVNKEDLTEIDDLRIAKCKKCEKIDYLFRMEVKDEEDEKGD